MSVPAAGSIADHDGGGDAPGALDRARRPLDQLVEGGAEADQRAEHRAELRHLPDRGDPVAGDVADHHHVAAVVEQDPLEPVAPHPDGRAAGR